MRAGLLCAPSVPIPILVVLPDASAVDATDAWLALAGGDLDATLGAGWLDLFASGEQGRVRALLDDGAPGGPIETRLADGRWVELRVGPAGSAYDDMVVVVATDLTAHKAVIARLAHEAMHDSLTGLLTRRVFVSELRRALSRREGSDGSVGVLFVDLEGFKAVNDRFGHAVGDRVLVRQAARMLDCLRPADLLARMGGDEFGVLCSDVSNEAEVHAVAHRLADVLRFPMRMAGEQVMVGASVGVALSKRTGDTPSGLLRRADEAMYVDKRRESDQPSFARADEAVPEHARRASP